MLFPVVSQIHIFQTLKDDCRTGAEIKTIMIIKKELKTDSKLSSEQISMLENLKNFPDQYDEDSPYYSREELQRMRKLAEERRAESQKRKS